MSRWEQYLYERHSREELHAWARRLRYFRFVRAIGGHANDGDRLLLALRHGGAADALALSAQLDPSATGRGHHVIGGIRVFVWTNDQTLTLSLSGSAGDPYSVTELDVTNAAALEPLIDRLQDRIIDPPFDDKHCLAPATYPELWSEQS
jgi:NAD(P)-dependent dehydrogenase (short-subunit alcohol dehydrogenase family)